MVLLVILQSTVNTLNTNSNNNVTFSNFNELSGNFYDLSGVVEVVTLQIYQQIPIYIYKF